MSIEFRADAAMRELQVRLVAVVKRLQTELLEEAQANMLTPEGAADLKEGEFSEAAGFIAALVVGGPDAVMDEWGTGSLMDTSNPDLEAYMHSSLWNPARPDTVIRGRPEGYYTDIHGETRYSSGLLEGVDLEQMGADFAPQPPSWAIQTAARWMANGRFRQMLRTTLSGFPWQRFLVVKLK